MDFNFRALISFNLLTDHSHKLQVSRKLSLAVNLSNMKTTTIFALLLSILISGCKQTIQDLPETRETDHPQVSRHEPMYWEKEMQLNRGLKWQANKETTAGIQKKSSLIKGTSAGTGEEYQQLGSDLIEEVNTLIKECTMKGSSHDNLHTYLEPLIINVAQLQQASSVEEGKEYTSRIKQHLQAYQRYFV